MERSIVASIESEFRRYKELCEKAFGQLPAQELGKAQSGTDNSIATLIWHISGNLESRFTDFLTADGEKPGRDRESEFEPRDVTHAEANAKWERGWECLFRALADLDDNDLVRQVTIRQVPFPVYEALHRSLAHTSYHAGQIVYLGKMVRGSAWTYLSIPPGGQPA